MIENLTNGMTISSSARRYFSRVVIAISVLINVLTGGQSNQTLSARNWERKRLGRSNLVPLLDFLSRNPTHCMENWTHWYLRKNVEQELTTTKQQAIIHTQHTKDI